MILSRKELKQIFKSLDAIRKKGLSEEAVMSFMDTLNLDTDTIGEVLLEYERKRSH